MGRLGSDFTLHSKRATEPLMVDRCSGTRVIRVGSEVEWGWRDTQYTHTCKHTKRCEPVHPGTSVKGRNCVWWLTSPFLKKKKKLIHLNTHVTLRPLQSVSMFYKLQNTSICSKHSVCTQSSYNLSVSVEARKYIHLLSEFPITVTTDLHISILVSYMNIGSSYNPK